MTEIHWAANRGDLAAFEAELAKGADPNERMDHTSVGAWTAVRFAAASRACDAETLRAIYEASRTVQPDQGAHALVAASNLGDIDKVDVLHAAGARVLRGKETEDRGFDHVPYRRGPGPATCVERVLSHLEGRAFDEVGPHLLHWTLVVGNRDVLERILRLVGDPEQVLTRWHYSALDRELILGAPVRPAAPTNRNELEDTLRLATRLGKIEAVAHWLELPHVRSEPFATPIALLMQAAAADAAPSVEWLLKNGAEADSFDEYEESPLQCALEHDSVNAARVLMDAGAPINGFARRENRRNASLAAYAAGIRTTELLIERGVDLDVENDLGFTPLRDAAEGDQVEIVRALLAAGADPNAHTDLGHTAIGTAVSLENWATIVALVEAGADLNIEDLDFDRPLDFAQSRATRKFLAAAGARPGTGLMGKIDRD